MTVPTSDNREQYEGNGTATTFDYAFKIFKAEDLTVIKTDAQGNELTLVQGTHYSVSGAGNENGGTVTYPLSGDPLATGETLTILRVIAVVQETDLRNQGAYYPETIEDELDRGRMIDQQQQEEIDRTLKFSEGGEHYDAQGKRIMNVGMPADNQDAMSKEAVTEYFKKLESGQVGDATKVTATGTVDERALSDWMKALGYPATSTGTQALSDSIDSRLVTVSSMSLLAASSAGGLFTKGKMQDGQLVLLGSFHPGKGFGGGVFRYDASRPVADHDGATVRSATVPWDGAYTTLIDFLNGVGETAVGGTGCFVRLDSIPLTATCYGLLGDGATDESTLAQRFIDANQGGTCVFDAGHSFIMAGVALDGAAYDNTKVHFLGEMKLRARASTSESTFGGAFIGLLFRLCDGCELIMRGNGNRAAQPVQEHVFLCAIAGASNFTSPLFHAKEIRGDGIYINQSDYQATSTIPTNLRFGEFDVSNTADDGRNAMSVISVDGLYVDSFRSVKIGGMVGVIQPGGFDIEPNEAYQTVKNVEIGSAYVDTAGNFGLQVYGADSATLGGNVSNVVIGSYEVISRCSEESVAPVAFRHCKNVIAKGTCVFQSTARAQHVGLTVDNAVAPEVEHTQVGGAYGTRIGASWRVVDANIYIQARDYTAAACQPVYVTRSKIHVKVSGGKTGSYAMYPRAFSRTGIKQDDVEYVIDAPASAGASSKGIYNEATDPMTFVSCRISGSLRGYVDFISAINIGAGMRRANLLGVTDVTDMPSNGAWAKSDIVYRSTPAIDANNMIVLGWVRLTDGTGATLGTDWGVIRVSHVSPAT